MSIAWQRVPKGPFTMGSDDHYDDEKPRHEVEISYDYLISRYPITQAQYRVFVEAGGYTEQSRPYWTAAGWQEKEEKGWTGPRQYGHPYEIANHPVVGVSWYEAVAFCRWLTGWQQARGLDLTGDALANLSGLDNNPWVIRLPTEAEWEKAARGTDGRIYPWGNEDPDSNWLNYKGEVGHTTAVGLYPRGVSPCGCMDMVGNVWEWCATRYGKSYPYDTSENEWSTDYLENQSNRSRRGGAWLNVEDHCRAAYRFNDHPLCRDLNQGFRVVVSPIF